MIIGPNGTGKSTVVCAIALGLGWKPSVLGRAKDVASYVKLGHSEGWVEIELQGFPGRANVVVRRILFRESNTSDWLLDGAPATVRQVNEAVSLFHIEVGNLCSFLPQDRVADFAAMTPSRLLQDTQQSAGHPDLFEWHTRLMDLGHKLAALQTRLEQEQSEHNHLEERNAVLERDVRRYEERLELEKQVGALQIRVAFAEFREAKERYNAARDEREAAKRTLEQILSRKEPLQERCERAEQQCAKADIRRSDLVKEADQALAGLKRAESSREQLDAHLASLGEQEKRLETAEQDRQRAIEELLRTINELEQRMAEGPPPPPDPALEQQLRAVKSEQRVLSEDVCDMEGQLSEQRTKKQRLHTRLHETQQTMERLNTVRYQRLQILARADHDAYEAVQWLQKNRGVFEKVVYDPVLVMVNIKNPEAARAIETCLSWPVQRTFVCQTRADYDLFTHELIDKRHWRLNVVEMEGAQPLESYAPPLTDDELHALGFDAYALQCIDAPTDVLRYLCSAAHLHAIPLAFEGRVNPARIESQRQIKRYISGDTIFTTTYSNYGQRLPQTMSRVLKPLRNFAHVGDMAERERAAALLRSLQDEMDQLGTSITQMEQEHAAQTAKLEALSAQRAPLATQIQEAQAAQRDWERLQIRCHTQREQLAHERNKPSVSMQRQQLSESRRKVAVDLFKSIERSLRLAQQLAEAHARSDKVCLDALPLATELEACRAELRQLQVQIEEGERALREVLAQFTEVKEQTLACRNRAHQRLDEASDEVRERVEGLLDEDTESSAHLASQLERAQAQLDVPWGVGANVIASFQARQEKIAQLKRTMEDGRHVQRQLEEDIAQLEAQWLPELEKLIGRVNERFSAAFARMYRVLTKGLGCAGEVRLSRDDDYEKWGIEILVKFRDTERLQPLTGQRQSGGERSLSTVLYLLSLTGLSRSPFSLVDEINQGMDPRAERAVHDQMVEMTCRAEAGQYFLITPKLLPSLRYHELMKILIINNGDWLPERLSLADLVRQKRARLA
ncbi:Structural maintenance of chromosomes protein 5 [Malassezia nana]|uniref:Structural maintenance of chromosomes protein 5 n=1 Tax=Malassezia nana TaxID=180528 RepID=A0AAF0J6R3_9BASI|nr:Structural maintenance of chromosomes protein 5 [Malassezia nana]